ncbi:hypothetical protein D3C83_142590 [compost metagenome]
MKMITGCSPVRVNVSFSQAARVSQKLPHGMPGSLVSTHTPSTPSPTSNVNCTKPLASKRACGKAARKLARSSWLPTSR